MRGSLQNSQSAVPCSGHDIGEIDENMAKQLGISFPQVHFQGEAMARLAQAVQKQQGSRFCVLPFCHTIEGEALGGNVNYGDARFGPRAGKAVCRTAAEVLALRPIDFSAGRMKEVLSACADLTQKGEAVLFNLSGPLTVLNILMETEDVFRLLMDFEQGSVPAQNVFQKLKCELLRFTEEIAGAGAAGISYADPLCSADILGDRLHHFLTERFSLPFLQNITALLTERAERFAAAPFFFLCPRLLPDNAASFLKNEEHSFLVGGCCVKSLLHGEEFNC